MLPELQGLADFLESVALVDLVAVLDLAELMEQQEHLGLVATLVSVDILDIPEFQGSAA